MAGLGPEALLNANEVVRLVISLSTRNECEIAARALLGPVGPGRDMFWLRNGDYSFRTCVGAAVGVIRCPTDSWVLTLDATCVGQVHVGTLWRTVRGVIPWFDDAKAEGRFYTKRVFSRDPPAPQPHPDDRSIVDRVGDLIDRTAGAVETAATGVASGSQTAAVGGTLVLLSLGIFGLLYLVKGL